MERVYKGQLNARELDRLAKRLSELEWQLENDWALRKINGGFVRIDLVDYNDEHIYLDLVSGVQCGCDDDHSTTEQASLDRQTLEWDD